MLVLVALLLLSAPVKSAGQMQAVVLDDDQTAPTPIAMGNLTSSGWSAEWPTGVCVDSDGVTYVTSVYPYWMNVRGESPASLIAWKADGSLLWTDRYSTFDRVLYDIIADESTLFVSGTASSALFIAELDFQGNWLWNATWDWDEIGFGLTIGTNLYMLEDGTVITSGVSLRYPDDSVYYFVVAFNQSGEELWRFVDGSRITTSCGADCIYIHNSNFLQKCSSDGSVIWTTVLDQDSRIYSSDGVVYTMTPQGPILPSSLALKRIDEGSGAQVAESTLSFVDGESNELNIANHVAEVTAADTLLFLIRVNQSESSHVVHLNSSLTPAFSSLLLDESWVHAIFALGQDGLMHVTGQNSILGMTLAVYNVTSIMTGNGGGFSGIDYLLVGEVAAGVVLLDVVLILYLKKKQAT